MGQILPGVVVLAFSLKGKNNTRKILIFATDVVLAFSLKGKNNLLPPSSYDGAVVLAFSLKGKNNHFASLLFLGELY